MAAEEPAEPAELADAPDHDEATIYGSLRLANRLWCWWVRWPDAIRLDDRRAWALRQQAKELDPSEDGALRRVLKRNGHGSRREPWLLPQAVWVVVTLMACTSVCISDTWIGSWMLHLTLFSFCMLAIASAAAIRRGRVVRIRAAARVLGGDICVGCGTVMATLLPHVICPECGFRHAGLPLGRLPVGRGHPLHGPPPETPPDSETPAEVVGVSD